MARGNGLPAAALLTDMNQVLGRAAGNAVEVRESVEHLTGAARDERLTEVTLALSAELLVLGGVFAGAAEAREAAGRALDGGAAAERFAAMVAELGGPSDLVDAPDRHLRAADVVRAVEPLEGGTVRGVDVRGVGMAVVGLGGGRARETDPVDHSVGFTEVAALGERVGPGERPLAIVHARDEASAERAADGLRRAVHARGCRRAPRGPRSDRDGRCCDDRRLPCPRRSSTSTSRGPRPPSWCSGWPQRNSVTTCPSGCSTSTAAFTTGTSWTSCARYDMAASVIRTAEDYRDITYEYLRDCAAEGAIYVELTASPDHARLVGLN